ncbi:hypothetical protein H0H87_012178 [Tephrocybe sp. NHM501043]|nr:hypothetical protein H0H87_012178 [Tephrocybe sp. NHM501043]
MQGSNSSFLSSPVSTPRRYAQAGPSNRPLNSSPLAAHSDQADSSPVVLARRRLQFKARSPSTPVASSSRTQARVISSSGGSVFASRETQAPLDPQKTFLREKFKARCFERAAKARDKVIKGKRYLSEPSSDGFDENMEGEDEEDDNDIMQDELFRRIMSNANRKARHSYRISYADDVGSSFDPDIEKADEWEHELTVSGSYSNTEVSQETEDLMPIDLHDEELEAYAEECARRAVLADFEDIPYEDLFSLSDVEEVLHPGNNYDVTDEDVEMMH